MNTDVIVIGAGLAGLSCAFELAEAGRRPLVLEAKPWLGGRTSSWTDPDGMELESGLHRVPGVYAAFPSLLERAGIPLAETILWENEVEFRQTSPLVSAVFSITPAKNPFSVAASLLANNGYLRPAAKLSLARLLASGLADHSADSAALDQISVLEYAARHDVHPEVIARFLEPLSAGIYFTPARGLSMYVFMALIAPYLPGTLKMRIGAFAGGMSAVLAEPLAEAIRRRGGEVRVNAPAAELLVTPGGVTGVRVGRAVHAAGHVVVASCLRATQRLLAPHFGDAGWATPLFGLGTMPGMTLQLELDRPAMEADRATFGVGTSLACFSEQSRTTFRGQPGRLSAILAPSDQFVDMPPEKILATVLDDADRLGLELRGHVRRYRVVPHLDDFYSLAPGNDRLRPAQATPVRGLSLAGDYTRQPNVATMEGAVISGRLAAEAAEADLARRT